MCSTRLPRETVSSWLWLLLCPVVASCTIRKRPCRHKLLHDWALCQQSMSSIVNPVATGAGGDPAYNKKMLCTRPRGSATRGSSSPAAPCSGSMDDSKFTHTTLQQRTHRLHCNDAVGSVRQSYCSNTHLGCMRPRLAQLWRGKSRPCYVYTA